MSVFLPILSSVVQALRGRALMYLDARSGRVRVLRPDATTLDLEHTGRRGAPGGYASLDSSGKVPSAQLPASGGGMPAPTGSGLTAYTASGGGSTNARTIQGTSGRISVSNGDGQGGDPTLDVGADVVLTGDARLSNSRTPTGPASGDLDDDYPGPIVIRARGLRESGGDTLSMGAVEDGEVLRRSGSTVASLPVATTPTADAIVQAQSDGTISAGWLSTAVKTVNLYTRFSILLPQGTSFNIDGAGTLSTSGIYGTDPSSAGFACAQIGDASAAASRAYIVASYKTQEGTIITDHVFQLGSDVTGSTQHYFIGLTSQLTLASADPTGHRAMIRYITGGTNWVLTTKDGTTETPTDTGVAVTASHFYVVRFTITTSAAAVRIGSGATMTAAMAAFNSAGSTENTTNLPGSTTALIDAISLQRAAASVNRCIKLAYHRLIAEPPYAG